MCRQALPIYAPNTSLSAILFALASWASESAITSAYVLRRENVHPREKSLVNINELSAILSIAKGTLYQWVYLRRIPFVKAGRCLRFDAEEVIAALPHFPTMGEAGKR
jgi:excisionase family DNA binding protein